MDEIATTPVLAFQASNEKTEQRFIDYSRLSKWTRILRTTAYVMRAARIFKDKGLQSHNKSPCFFRCLPQRPSSSRLFCIQQQCHSPNLQCLCSRKSSSGSSKTTHSNKIGTTTKRQNKVSSTTADSPNGQEFSEQLHT